MNRLLNIKSLIQYHKKIGFRQFWKKYGLIGIGVYETLYLLTLSGCYIGVSTSPRISASAINILNRLNIQRFLTHLPLSFNNQSSTTLSNFTIAWLCTKILEPTRIMATIVITPSIIRTRDRLLQAKTGQNSPELNIDNKLK